MFEISLILLFLLGLTASIVLLKIGWSLLKEKAVFWGVNFRRFRCPKCDSPTPLARRPASVRQALWGGWTCSECHAEIDKFGTDISSSLQNSDRKFQLGHPFDKLQLGEHELSPLERVFDDGNEKE